jgi:hypothetical protein
LGSFKEKEHIFIIVALLALTTSINIDTSPLSRSECTSVGAGSPQPVAMIGAAWGEKDKLHGRS